MLVPVAPNWSGGFRETLEFQTEVIVSRSGREQRRAKRQNPRQSFSFNFLVDRDRARAVESAILRRAGGTIEIGDYRQPPMFVGANAPAGATSILVSAVAPWFTAPITLAAVQGNHVVFLEVPTTDLTVSGFDSGYDPIGFSSGFGAALTLSAPLAEPLAGGTALYPTIEGRLERDFRLSAITSEVARGTMDIQITPGTPFIPTPAVTTLGGREIFTLENNWSGAMDMAFSNYDEVVDYGIGVTSYYLPIDFVSRTTQVSVQCRTKAQIDAVRNFFLRTKGRRDEFYASSNFSDLRPTVGFYSGQTALRIAGKSLAQTIDPTLLALCITTLSGLKYYVRVASVVEENTALAPAGPEGTGDLGNQSLVTITDALPITAALSSIASISYAPLSRFAADTLVIDYVTDSVASAVLNIMSLENPPV